jgi:NAD(P)-dependent dehydrogenase (short-subunit alcohol dehydrogenase family)
MVKDLSREGRVVVVTGAGTGLGRAYALYLAKLGWRVVVNNRRRPASDGGLAPSSADAVVEDIRRAGGHAIAQYDDVRAEGAGQRMLETALNAWGRLDALVNNAGVDQHAPFHKISLASFHDIFRTNFDGTVAVTHTIYPYLRDRADGAIVVSVSSAGLHGLHGLSAYAASKAALIAFARSLSAEGASRNVRVSAVAPYAATRMTDAHLTTELRAAMSPEHVAPVIAALIAPGFKLGGHTWLAGAGWVRRAGCVEWIPGFAADDDPQRMQEHMQSMVAPGSGVAPMLPREFPDALAAHADFMASAQQGLRSQRGG